MALRLAYLSPLPPAATGVADYSAALLPALARHAEVEVLAEPAALSAWRARRADRDAKLALYPLSEFEARADRADAIIYHLGNSAHYGAIYERLIRRPGIVVLHDGTLHHFYVDRTLHRGDAPAYLREMAYSHGAAGYDAARLITRGAGVYPFYRFPLIRRAVDAARGVIVHGETIRQAVLEARPVTAVCVIPHLAFQAVPPARTRAEVLRRFGWPPDAFVIGSFGLVSPEKRGEALLEAFEAVAAEEPRARLLFVGRSVPEYDLRTVAQERGLDKRIRFAGHVRHAALPDYLSAIDAAVNLRWPTAGEASGAVMRLLAYGKPTIVSRAGWFAELPRDAVIAVDVGEREVAQITTALRKLMRDPQARAVRGAAARDFAARLTPDAVAQQYVSFIEETIRGKHARDG
ncbi:MAG: glycosyltransferase family 4 protein [Rudaea sp.]